MFAGARHAQALPASIQENQPGHRVLAATKTIEPSPTQNSDGQKPHGSRAGRIVGAATVSRSRVTRSMRRRAAGGRITLHNPAAASDTMSARIAINAWACPPADWGLTQS